MCPLVPCKKCGKLTQACELVGGVCKKCLKNG